MSWESSLAAFWEAADDTQPERAWHDLESLLADAPAAVAAFERASLHDFLGEEESAVPLYRRALELGLEPPRVTYARIQLASSLRNIGDPSGAMTTLRGVADDDPLATARDAFLALALYDDEKPTEALRTALRALAPSLPEYSHALRSYAETTRPIIRMRTVAVGLLADDGWVLAEEYPATDAHATFLRLPGGGVEYGETAAHAVRRELREELAAEVTSAELATVIENIYDDHGRSGHEIVFVFVVRSPQLERLPRDARLPVQDSHTTVGWYRIDALRSGELPLYPVGALDLLP